MCKLEPICCQSDEQCFSIDMQSQGVSRRFFWANRVLDVHVIEKILDEFFGSDGKPAEAGVKDAD